MEIPQDLAGRPISVDPVEEGSRMERWSAGSEVWDVAHRAALCFGRTSGYRPVLDQVPPGSTARSDHGRGTTASCFAGPSTASAGRWSAFDTAPSTGEQLSSYEVVAAERSWAVGGHGECRSESARRY
jgi:hypothetical protein